MMYADEVYSYTRHSELGYDRYKISSLGKVIKEDNEPVELQVDGLGQQYFVVKDRKYFVSDLVLETFFTEITANPMHTYGITTEYLVQHLNGDKTNNRALNLRPITVYKYVKMNPSNHIYRSNHKGVFYCRLDKKWYVEVCTPKEDICIGSCTTEEEAVKLRHSI